MATANITAAEELISCPVCYEEYRDPRSLKCAHQFCLKCLEKIATTRHGQREITCPTCRVVTPLTAGSQVSELPRPVIANELQEMIKTLLMPETEEKSRKCDNCEGRKAIAIVHCFGCKENMCDMCYTEHQDVTELANHKTAPISDFILCVTHHEEITMYCHDCQRGICNRCVRKEHKRHKKEDIGTVAKSSRDKVREFIQIQQTTAVSSDMLELVQGKVQEIECQRDTVVDKLDHTLDLIRTLEDKVRMTRTEVLVSTSVDINVLNQYKSSLSDLIASQVSMGEFSQYLAEKASDPEVVARATELLSPPSMAAHNPTQTINIPEISREFLDVEKLLQSLTTVSLYRMNSSLLNMPSRKMVVSGVIATPTVEPIQSLKRQERIKLNDVCDVTINPALSQLVVKTRDTKAPIKVYDLKCNKLTQFGGGIDGLSGDGFISLDSHRDLYLAACDGHLTTVTMDGQRKDRINMKGCNLRGVAYIRENDLYVVSHVTEHKISLIDPRAKPVVRSFGSRGSNPGQFNQPRYITTYTDQGKPVIVISDWNNHRVQLLDLYGTPLRTFGSYGKGDGQLNYPDGVVVDPKSRIIVADNSNRRVVSFWTEDGQDKWQCLIPLSVNE